MIEPPIEPMLAALADQLPASAGFLFEPKWDGFRAIVFRKTGEVFIQTYAPFHPAVQSARTADFETFYDQEIEFRRELRYPPFTRLTTVLFKGPDEAVVDACSKDFAEKLQPEQVLRHVPVPRPKIQPKAYRPGFTPRAMTAEQRRLAESWMWTPGYSRPGE